MTTVSPGRRYGPACSRMTPAMSSPGISTGVRIGTRSKVRPSTTTVRGAGAGSVIAPMVPGAVRQPGGCGSHRPPLRSRVPCRPSRPRPRSSAWPRCRRGAGARRRCSSSGPPVGAGRGARAWARSPPAATTTSSPRRAATATGRSPSSTRSSASRRPTSPPDLVRVVQPGVAGQRQGPRGHDRRPAGDERRRGGRRRRDRGPERLPQLRDQQVACSTDWVDVHGYERALQLPRARATRSTSSGLAIDFRSDPRSVDAQRLLGRNARGQVDEGPRLGIRLRDELPEGQDRT